MLHKPSCFLVNTTYGEDFSFLSMTSLSDVSTKWGPTQFCILAEGIEAWIRLGREPPLVHQHGWKTFYARTLSLPILNRKVTHGVPSIPVLSQTNVMVQIQVSALLL